MHLTLLAVGKLRPYYRDACDEYLKRIGRYTTVTEREVKEAGRAPTPAVQRRIEGERLLAAMPPEAAAVALAIDGHQWSSEELARQVDRWRRGRNPVVLVIGGATGLGPEVLARCAIRWSLGPLTLPHELARVVVTEQVYRAFTILGGGPYHK